MYPSSQTCSFCGCRNPLVKNLCIRIWECPKCHTVHDREMVQEIDLADEPLAQLAEFDAKGLAEEVRGEFAPMEEEELSVFTKEMADEYITRAVKFCVEEMKTLSAGKSGLDSTAWSWEKPENMKEVFTYEHKTFRKNKSAGQ